MHGARAIVKPCLLPSLVLAVFFSPIEDSPALVQFYCSLQKDLHLTLVSSNPHPSTQHTRAHTSFFSIFPLLPSSLEKKAGRECRCWTHLSSFLILSLFSFFCALSIFLIHFFSLCRPLWMEQLLHHRVNTLTYWTTQGKLSITTAACLFVVSFFLSLCWLGV